MSQSYMLLKPVSLAPQLRDPVYVGTDFPSALAALGPGPYHFDLETNQLDPLKLGAKIIGLGLASPTASVYLDPRAWGEEGWAQVGAWMSGATGASFGAFNAVFDCAWIQAVSGHRVNLRCCTMVWFKLLANEGWDGQSHSLETALTDLLKLDSNQKSDLDRALTLHQLKGKGEMYKLADLEPAMFAKYCAQDAQASLLLEDYFRAECERLGAHGSAQYATEEWPSMIGQIVDARLRGLQLDVQAAKTAKRRLMLKVNKLEGMLRKHELVAPHLKELEAELAAKFYRLKIQTKRIKATSLDEVDPDDPAWQFEPSEAKSLKAWQREQGGIWFKEATEVTVPKGTTPQPRFNWKSHIQLCELLYERIFTDWAPGPPDPTTGLVTSGRLTVGGRDYDISLGAGGYPSTDRKTTPALGPIGQWLTERSHWLQLTSYLDAYLQHGGDEGVLHAGYKPHKAITGRLGGGS